MSMSPEAQHDADVAVIGLGAIGAMAAWRLAVRGHGVHGYERFGIGHDRGAFSGQTRRFSVQSQREPRLTPLALQALDLWRGLESATGRSLLHLVGGLILGPSDAPALVAAHASARAAGLDHEVLDSAELKERFPQHLVRAGDAGVLDPKAGFLRPELSVVTAAQRAEELGAVVFDHTRVLGVEPEADGVVVRTETGSRRYAHVVVAPGARARDVLPAMRTAVLPRRVVQAWYVPDDIDRYRGDVFPVFERVGDVNAYGFPVVDGATIKIGIYTTGHPVVHDTDNPPLTVGRELLHLFRDAVATYFPGLHADPVATTIGLEGYTTDGQPLLGALPDEPRIIVACGFSGAGFKFAPAVGDVVADLVTDGRTPRDVDFLAPDRPLADWPPDALTPA
ncbi:N-methyl-L-tryptophan oxidase [Saccharopolyspora sp. WRP15-2]|uniref:N-methyl-L-tryptophan oxidase n=1 Tax=Saccharopolyspora oryzae TaxID=2997343 RepID=A0ABT4UUY2_9PSEU|nr:N-methyl-L-tryptophan oxidase [Saccharopolyspora oryzae]MDA3625528.1 N-methyl-L-tryptophan oxidase [Saccharopolyspora oryzae]